MHIPWELVLMAIEAFYESLEMWFGPRAF